MKEGVESREAAWTLLTEPQSDVNLGVPFIIININMTRSSFFSAV
jgi:hypothetical protein